MKSKIREAKPKDFDRLEEILIQNNMLNSPEVDGKIAMEEIYKRMGKYFLVAEIDDQVLGMIRGCYDGSRALIHQMVVDKNYQRQGIGKQMMYEITLKFKLEGAKSISVTATEKSKRYYEKLGFLDLPITLMLSPDISEAIKNTKANP